jgi:DNA-binding Lrp family transcriptional regulator
MSMDEKDFELLKLLCRDGRMTGPALSEHTGLPLTTVHNRVKRLERDGVVRGYSAVLDEKKMGNAVSAFILVSVHYPEGKRFSQEEVARKIKTLGGVQFVAVITGESDILLRVNVKDVDALNRLVTAQIRAIPGVDQTRTMVVLNDLA